MILLKFFIFLNFCIEIIIYIFNTKYEDKSLKKFLTANNRKIKYLFIGIIDEI